MAERSYTTIEVDDDLLRGAQEVLGTTEADETVRRALTEVVDMARRRAAVEYPFVDFTPEILERERRGESVPLTPD